MRRGNILSIYERPLPTSDIMQTEVHIYGSSRLGIEQRNITYSTSPFAWLESEQHRHAGTKRYELADHLGNVRVTISDLLVPRPASSFGYATQDAEVIDRRDYYPFGMEMPGRRWRAATEAAGRFGFNGKENDNEVKGEGNQQDYGFRIYDPRVARFLSVDPLTANFSSLSPFQYASLNPIYAIDVDGLEGISYREGTVDKVTGEFTAIRRVIALDLYIATGDGHPNAMQYPDDFNIDAYIQNTFNEGDVRDEAGLPVEYRISVKKIDAKWFSSDDAISMVKNYMLSEEFLQTDETYRPKPDEAFVTFPYALMYQDPSMADQKANGRNEGEFIRVSPNRGNYKNGEIEVHELVHRMLQGAGLMQRVPDELDEDAQHALGGNMKYRIDTVDKAGNVVSSQFDPRISQQAHDAIVKSVPRGPDRQVAPESPR